MLMLGALLHSSRSACAEIGSGNYSIRVNYSGCVIATDCLFRDTTSASDGGAIHLQTTATTASVLTGCTFIECQTQDHWGGACFVDAPSVEFARCCGLTCQSWSGSFLMLKSAAAADHASINSTVAHGCATGTGDSDTLTGTFRMGRYVVPRAADVNVSLCFAQVDGPAFQLQDHNEIYTRTIAGLFAF
jgi:hypothetical protein